MIRFFRGKHGFLSNFHPARVRLDDVEYPTVENAYQAAKVDEFVFAIRKRFQTVTPGAAKTMGRNVALRPDWESVKLVYMLDLVRQKFRWPELALQLVQTDDEYLIEGNHWHDNYWGICACERCPGVGENRLGLILMQVREEIRR